MRDLRWLGLLAGQRAIADTAIGSGGSRGHKPRRAATRRRTAARIGGQAIFAWIEPTDRQFGRPSLFPTPRARDY
jgi:hypothetical protein